MHLPINVEALSLFAFASSLSLDMDDADAKFKSGKAGKMNRISL
jgi:hypothetical protein